MRPIKDVAAETGIDVQTVGKVAAALSRASQADPETVKLRHPKLPSDQVIEVDRRRAGARFASGWVEVMPETPEPPAKRASASPEPNKPASPEKSTRPRRKSTEEQ